MPRGSNPANRIFKAAEAASWGPGDLTLRAAQIQKTRQTSATKEHGHEGRLQREYNELRDYFKKTYPKIRPPPRWENWLPSDPKSVQETVQQSIVPSAGLDDPGEAPEVAPLQFPPAAPPAGVPTHVAPPAPVAPAAVAPFQFAVFNRPEPVAAAAPPPPPVLAPPPEFKEDPVFRSVVEGQNRSPTPPTPGYATPIRYTPGGTAQRYTPNKYKIDELAKEATPAEREEYQKHMRAIRDMQYEAKREGATDDNPFVRINFRRSWGANWPTLVETGDQLHNAVRDVYLTRNRAAAGPRLLGREPAPSNWEEESDEVRRILESRARREEKYLNLEWVNPGQRKRPISPYTEFAREEEKRRAAAAAPLIQPDDIGQGQVIGIDGTVLPEPDFNQGPFDPTGMQGSGRHRQKGRGYITQRWF